MRNGLIALFILVLVGGIYWWMLPEDESLTVYSGRSKALVEPLIQKFQDETGIIVEVKYAGTTQLAVALMEEAEGSPADVFWAQDAGALGALSNLGLLAQLPADIVDSVDPRFVNANRTWVASSGRARVLAFAPTRVDTLALPVSVFDLVDPKYAGKVAWAPSNGSFQAFVSAMIEAYGIESTRAWLIGMKENGSVAYANNNAILQGIAAGEVDYGITNHYYLYRSLAEDAAFPVDQTFFESGDLGNMLNVAGLAQVASSTRNEAALQFIRFMLSDASQEYFSNQVYEYPIRSLDGSTLETDYLQSIAPDVDLEKISDLEATINLLRDIGLL
jgi:iron(III) transport system substrate-binding protein